MTRLVAALLAVALCTVFTLAEEEKPPVRFPFGPSQTTLPFEVVQQDGKTAWKIVGKGSVRVEDLVGGLSTANALRVSYSQYASSRLRENLPYVGPDAGVVIPSAELADYSSELLSAAGLTLVGASTGKARVVSTSEAPAYALYVAESDLEKLAASEWVVVRGAPKYASMDVISMVAQSRRRADGSVSFSAQAGSFIITGMAGEIRTMLRLMRDLDQPGAGSEGKLVRVYDIPASVKAADAALVIRALFEEPGQTIQNVEKNIVIMTNRRSDLNVTALPANNRIVVRATAGDHALVQSTIDSMK